MKAVSILAVYVAMLAFDLAIFAGTAYLVLERGWSAWWFAFAVIVAGGSYPKRAIEAISGLEAA